MSSTPYVTGREIGQAERAMQQLLAVVLKGTPLPTAEHWVALTALATTPASLSTADLSSALRANEDAVVRIARELERIELAEEVGGWLPTAAGRALFEEIGVRIRAVTASLTDGVEPTEIEATRRVLATLTERASSLAGSLGSTP